MFHSFAVMPKLQKRDDLVDEKSPSYCVVKTYFHDDPEYNRFPLGLEFMTGEGFENLTMTQAEQKADELDNSLHGQASDEDSEIKDGR